MGVRVRPQRSLKTALAGGEAESAGCLPRLSPVLRAMDPRTTPKSFASSSQECAASGAIHDRTANREKQRRRPCRIRDCSLAAPSCGKMRNSRSRRGSMARSTGERRGKHPADFRFSTGRGGYQASSGPDSHAHRAKNCSSATRSTSRPADGRLDGTATAKPWRHVPRRNGEGSFRLEKQLDWTNPRQCSLSQPRGTDHSPARRRRFHGARLSLAARRARAPAFLPGSAL